MSQNASNPLEPTADPAPAVGIAAPAVAAEPAIPVHPGAVKSTGGVSNRALNVLLGGAVVLAIAGIAFAVGRMTAPAQTITAGSFPGGNLPGGGVFTPGGQGTGNGQNRPGGLFGGGGATIEGTVESVSATTLTLKTADGQTIQIALDGSTTYHAQSDASASDVVTGGKVLVRLDFRRVDGTQGGPQATAGTGGGPIGGLTAHDVTVVP